MSHILESLMLLAFMLFQHLGGHGPYQSLPELTKENALLPPQCSVSQVLYLGRHGERYPTIGMGKAYERTLHRLVNSNTTGPLQFLNEYQYFVTDPHHQYGHLTSTGPFNGVDGSRKRAAQFRARYKHLFQQLVDTTFPVFTASSARVKATAKLFAQSLGLDSVHLVTIPESHDQGANSLTPDRSCRPYNSSVSSQHFAFFENYFQETVESLSKHSPNVALSISDVRHLIELCPFELTATGERNFCSIFSDHEHVLNGYARAIRYYYKNGPGNELSSTIGSVYANATLNLLQTENALPVYVSFTHDSHLNFFLSTLGVFTGGPLSSSTPDWEHPWVHGDLTPMGASIVIEKITCSGENETPFVRLFVNDALVPFHDCTYGPGLSCSLTEFSKTLQRQNLSYVDDCQLDKDLPQSLSFYWDWDQQDHESLVFQTWTVRT